METGELLSIIANGEDSRHQFKSDVSRSESLAREMAAFSNAQGGIILIGVTDDGNIAGLGKDDIHRLNQLISNAATDHVRPPIAPTTQNFSLPDGKVMAISVSEGISKPYMDKNLHVYVRSGADKRKVNSREELMRIFRNSTLVHGDGIPVHGSSTADIDKDFFDAFLTKEYGMSINDSGTDISQILENMNLAKAGQLNLCGTLLFASRPQHLLPVFNVKSVFFEGTQITGDRYIDSRDFDGTLSDIFSKALGFLLTNLRHVQNGQSVNSIGEPEIPRIALEELLANALVHRDYFVSAPIKTLIFRDRVEIISPGHLPNNLTIQNIKMGNSNIRNPILASFASKLLPYRGLGSGIKRAIEAYPNIEFVDDRDGNTFQVIFRRNEA